MAKRKDEREEEQDRGTKADHGIGRPDAEMENRATKAELADQNDTEWLKDPKAELTGGNDTDWLKDPKAELGGNDDTTWLKDPKAELTVGNDTEWIKDPKADIVDPVHTEGADLLDTATVPQFQEGADIADPVHTEGADLLDTATVPQFQEGGHHILASLAQPRSSCLRV